MPKTSRSGQPRTGKLPGTLRRSSKEAQETFTKAHDSAVQAYGEGDEADRAAYSALKHRFEKRGDHWIAKGDPRGLASAAAATVGVWMSYPPRPKLKAPRLRSTGAPATVHWPGVHAGQESPAPSFRRHFSVPPGPRLRGISRDSGPSLKLAVFLEKYC